MTPHELLIPPGIHDPDVAIIVHVDPVGPSKHSRSKLVEDPPLLVELKHDVQVIVLARPIFDPSDTVVRAAAVDGPDGFSVRRDLHQAGRTPIPAIRKRGPDTGHGPIRVGRIVLGLQRNRGRTDSGADENKHQTNSASVRHETSPSTDGIGPGANRHQHSEHQRGLLSPTDWDHREEKLNRQVSIKHREGRPIGRRLARVELGE